MLVDCLVILSHDTTIYPSASVIPVSNNAW